MIDSKFTKKKLIFIFTNKKKKNLETQKQEKFICKII